MVVVGVVVLNEEFVKFTGIGVYLGDMLLVWFSEFYALCAGGYWRWSGCVSCYNY